MPTFNDMVYHSGGMPAGGALTGGNIFWVDSGASLAADAITNGKSRDKPFATLDYAVGRCTANNGDVIYLAEKHAETVATAAAINVDVAGIQIIGLGQGADRPTFTFSATASTITVTAASVTINNIVIVPSIDSVASPIVASAADCSLLNVEVQDASAAIECVRLLLTTAAADRLLVDGLVYRGFVAGNACVNAIHLIGVNDCIIRNSNFYGEFSTAVIEMKTTASDNVTIDNCYFYNDNVALSKNVVDTGGTGSIWQASDCFDGKGGYSFSGGSAAALAGDDIGSVSTGVSTNTSFATTSSAAVSGLTSFATTSSTAVSGLTSFATTSSTAVSGLTSWATTSSAAVSGMTSRLLIVSTTQSTILSYLISGY